MGIRKGLITPAVIGGVAVIVAALIGVAHHYLLKGEEEGARRIQVISPSRVERELSNVNIYLSDTDENQVRQDLQDDPAYRKLAEDCLEVMRGRRLSSGVPLNMINGMYKREFGVPTNGYIQADRYDALGKVRQAIFDAWAKKQDAGYWERGFNDIAVPINQIARPSGRP